MQRWQFLEMGSFVLLGASGNKSEFDRHSATAQRVQVQLDGVKKPAASGLLTFIASDDPEATNTLHAPQRIAPRVLPVKGIAKTFSVELPAYSVGVLEFETP